MDFRKGIVAGTTRNCSRIKFDSMVMHAHATSMLAYLRSLEDVAIVTDFLSNSAEFVDL